MGKPKHLIYGLVDPRDKALLYAGKSSSGLSRPNKPHKHGDVGHWVAELAVLGLTPETVVLEVVPHPKMPSSSCPWWTGINTTALNDRERWWIAFFGRADRGTGALLNNTDGGGGTVGLIASAETCKKISDSKRGRKRSPETCKRISLGKRGRKQAPDVVARRAAKLRGKKRTGAQRAAQSRQTALQRAKRKTDPESIARDRQTLIDRDATGVTTCGTANAYKRAMRRIRDRLPNCGPCNHCILAYRAYKLARGRTYGHVSFKPASCGTESGYRKALRLNRGGQASCGPCNSCRMAKTNADRSRRTRSAT